MRVFILCAAAAACFVGRANAYVVVTDQHVDVIGVTYSPADGLGVRVHTDTADYLPDSVLIYDGPSRTTSVTRPGGSQWDFLGVGAGETLYYWPQSTIAGRVYAGFEAQTVPSNTFQSHLPDDPRISAAARWLRIELVDVRFFDLDGSVGEADFSLWTVSGVGVDPVVRVSTADGISESDVFYITEGGHSHTNWGFTRAGYYQIDFRVSGILASTGRRIESAVTTFHLGVEHLPAAIPEPGVFWLLGAGALAFGIRRVCLRHTLNQP